MSSAAKTAFCLAFVALPSVSSFLFPASSSGPVTRQQPLSFGTCGVRVSPETRYVPHSP